MQSSAYKAKGIYCALSDSNIGLPHFVDFGIAKPVCLSVHLALTTTTFCLIDRQAEHHKITVYISHVHRVLLQLRNDYLLLLAGAIEHSSS